MIASPALPLHPADSCSDGFEMDSRNDQTIWHSVCEPPRGKLLPRCADDAPRCALAGESQEAAAVGHLEYRVRCPCVHGRVIEIAVGGRLLLVAVDPRPRPTGGPRTYSGLCFEHKHVHTA